VRSPPASYLIFFARFGKITGFNTGRSAAFP
jgi:hypothetical protein